jgi:hypothetical protein
MYQLRWGDPNKTREAIVDVSADKGKGKPKRMDRLEGT